MGVEDIAPRLEALEKTHGKALLKLDASGGPWTLVASVMRSTRPQFWRTLIYMTIATVAAAAPALLIEQFMTRFDAIRAQRIGLVHEVVEGEAALDAAVEAAIADLLAAGPTAARAAKAIVREIRGLGHGASKWHTARVIARQRTSPEAEEGFRAFQEKRRPSWAPDPD